MPTYDYRCQDCGEFSVMRPIARRDEPCACPGCGKSSERALIAAPALASMPAASRRAHAINERSAAAPRESARSGHGPGCGCCGKVKLAEAPAHTAKGNPAGRPWMISH
ncbi:zinc ribbon domain-containing protein [Cupriavidus basilensis]|uniref:Zinc ribbon domain-containing protein n=1 Tax=Cupriavidus basilensis TaxID=68895 RepID=A0ABT6B5H7_9BURK|nr:zinc ribbon domain-containing protein [Cupriavidus basilensis]MDF3839216.1 zinc ribbon domain-containing protein [Cupriavidus basilensis]